MSDNNGKEAVYYSFDTKTLSSCQLTERNHNTQVNMEQATINVSELRTSFMATEGYAFMMPSLLAFDFRGIWPLARDWNLVGDADRASRRASQFQASSYDVSLASQFEDQRIYASTSLHKTKNDPLSKYVGTSTYDEDMLSQDEANKQRYSGRDGITGMSLEPMMMEVNSNRDRVVRAGAASRSINKRSQLEWIESGTQDQPTRQTASLDVPLDYRDRSKGTISIAMARIPATGKAKGSLFFNPGGPGAPGIDSLGNVANMFSDEIKKRFHIVTWDPRGLGQSKPALGECQQPYPVLPATGPIDWKTALNNSREVLKDANQECQSNNDSIINYLGTRNVARDLNQMRVAVGDKQLTYYGASYGTRIGYTYAVQNPGKVRAMVLDGNISPRSNFADLISSANGPNLAFEFLTEEWPELAIRVQNGVEQLNAQPIQLQEGAEFTRWDYTQQVITNLMFSQFEQLQQTTSDIDITFRAAEGSEAAVNRLAGLKRNSGVNENAGGLFSIVNSIDYTDRPRAKEQLNRVKNIISQGDLGSSLAISYATGAAGLDVTPDPVPDLSKKSLREKVANVPVLVANATHDTITPITWAKVMKQSFANSSFIKQAGTNHTILMTGDECVRKPIEAFLLTGEKQKDRLCPWPKPENMD